MPINATGTEGRVCEDIANRQALGFIKYGTTVENNKLTVKQWLQHAYEETLDKAVYLKRAIEEMDKQDAIPVIKPERICSRCGTGPSGCIC